MNKHEFLTLLRERLHGLPTADVEERVRFYSEMIDDRMEDGLSEEDAVAAIDPIEEIFAKVVADIPFAKLAKAQQRTRKRASVWTIVLLVLGSPIWLSLGISAVAVLLSLYVSVWAVVVSLWAVFASLAGGAIGGVAGACVWFVCRHSAAAVALLAAAFLCGGLAIFAFYGCKAVTRGLCRLTKWLVVRAKLAIVKTEVAK